MLFLLLIILGVIGTALFAVWAKAETLPQKHPGRNAARALNITVVSVVLAIPLLAIFGLMGALDPDFAGSVSFIVWAWIAITAVAWGRVLVRTYGYYVLEARPRALARYYAAVEANAAYDAAKAAPAFAHAEPAGATTARIDGPAQPQAAPPPPSSTTRKSRG